MLGDTKRDRKAERHAATRTEIVEVAWQIARAEGLAALSLRDVARAVGMQPPSLYSYFDSKNAIYDAMFAQGAREFVEEQAKLTPTGDPLTDITAEMRFFADFCTRDPARYQLLFQRTIPGFAPSAESMAISLKGLDALRQLLAQSGFTDPRAVDLCTAVGTGLIDQQISNDPGGDRWLRLIDEVAEMLTAHLAARQTTSTRRTRT
jgi:AcrR family transcriptional regulator